MRISIAIAMAAALSGAAAAHDFRAGDLVIEHPWSRATPPGARIGVGYATITNNGAEPDRLIGGSSEVSKGFEVHTSEVVDGVARMRPARDGIVIAPGETVVLEPGGTHAMLTGMTQPIEAGEPFAGTLVFERAGALDVAFAVQELGASAAPAGDDHEGHDR